MMENENRKISRKAVAIGIVVVLALLIGAFFLTRTGKDITATTIHIIRHVGGKTAIG